MSETPATAEPAPASAPGTTFTSAPSLSAFQKPLSEFLETHGGYDGIAVGACVFRNADPAPASEGGAARRDRILLLQRAATDSMPLRWEIPGGACDFEDESLLHALARELWEESGLTMRAVRALVTDAGNAHAIGRNENLAGGGGVADVFLTRGGRSVRKFSFITDTEPGQEVKLNPEEHAAFLWVSEEEAERRECGGVRFSYTTDRQAQIVRRAFELRREMGSS